MFLFSDIFRKKLFLIQVKDDTYGVAEHCDIYQQMPHEVVISKSLLGVDNSSDGIEDSSSANQHQEWGRGVVPKEREEDDNHPAHNKIYGEAY